MKNKEETAGVSDEELKNMISRYRETVINNLVRKYSMSETDAENAFEDSVVALMLEKRESAIWQMHQSLESALNDIYAGYSENISNVNYWVYEFKMSDIAHKILEEVCSKCRLSFDEFFEEALKYSIQKSKVDPEGFKQNCLETDKNSEIDIKMVHCYPVYKGETEAEAIDRKLQEEILRDKEKDT